VRVAATEALRVALQDKEFSCEDLIAAFTEWKTGWPKREFDSKYFGKDAAYAAPAVDGKKYILRHVHIVPVVDPDALSRWQKILQRLGRKTSDRALVYAQDDRGNFLLIFILEEPYAHRVAEMRTQGDREIMEGFANTAAAFIAEGKVIR